MKPRGIMVKSSVQVSLVGPLAFMVKGLEKLHLVRIVTDVSLDWPETGPYSVTQEEQRIMDRADQLAQEVLEERQQRRNQEPEGYEH